MTSWLRRHWKAGLLTGMLVAAGLGGLVYWNYFRVDPEFARQDRAQRERIDKLDELLGNSGDDDFSDLER